MYQIKRTPQVKSWACLLAVATSCFLPIATVVAQLKTFVPSSDVSFKISTERVGYKAGESITLKYTVKNISNAALFVPREWEATCPAGPHLWAWFEDSAGKHFVPGYGGSCFGGPKTVSERMNKEAVLCSAPR